MTMLSIAGRCKGNAVQRATVVMIVALCGTVAGAAQSTPAPNPPPPVQTPELAEIRRILAEQQRQIDAQRREIDELTQRLNDARMVALTTSNQVAALERQVPAATSIEHRLEQIERAGQQDPGLPSAVVTAADFPGSLKIPGTDTALKFGGQARMTLVHTLGALGTDDRFVTSSIPVGSERLAGEDSRTNYSAKASRVNLEVRLPTPTPLRTFIETDFFDTGNTARLRHAFIQTDSFIVGQTWSTFSDPEAEPTGIDLEGLNAISMLRQSQIRYSRALKGSFRLALALENPAPDLTGAQGVNLTPDVIARVRWEPTQVQGPLGRPAHVQAAILIRSLRGAPTELPEQTLSTGGFGLNISGVLVPRWDADDRVKFAANGGWGIGRYITDLGTLGGQDAIYDAIGNRLRALRVSSGYFGYERRWRPTILSAFTYGIVNVANLDSQPGDSLRRTQRTTMNFTWSPIAQADIVLEFLAGTRVNKDGQRAASSQVQAGWLFRF